MTTRELSTQSLSQLVDKPSLEQKGKKEELLKGEKREEKKKRKRKREREREKERERKSPAKMSDCFSRKMIDKSRFNFEKGKKKNIMNWKKR